MHRIPIILLALAVLVLGTAIGLKRYDDAAIVSRNLSKSADNFEVYRRVVFVNGITDSYLLEIVGLCSIKEDKLRGATGRPSQLEVVCKREDGDADDPDVYQKHFLGLSDNVTYFVEQLRDIPVSAYHYRTTFKPQTIIPDIDLRISLEELTTNSSEINQ